MIRRTHESRKKDDDEKMEAQSSSFEKLIHLQKSVKKIEPPK
jgi:hypothetical protein